jgi:hypothetical protein
MQDVRRKTMQGGRASLRCFSGKVSKLLENRKDFCYKTGGIMEQGADKDKKGFGSFIKKCIGKKGDCDIKNELEWPFDDSQNVAVFTSTKIINENKPILYVAHDEDDGAWQFHSGEMTKTKEAMIVSLKEIYSRDASIGLLANLPYGYIAERKSLQHEWVVNKKVL